MKCNARSGFAILGGMKCNARSGFVQGQEIWIGCLEIDRMIPVRRSEQVDLK